MAGWVWSLVARPLMASWRGGLASEKRALSGPQAKAYGSETFLAFRTLLSNHAVAPNANLSHPYFERARPRTMLIEEVETIWAPIAEADDWTAFAAAIEEIEDMGRAHGVETFTIN